jgi:hypothetical protein
MDHAVVFTPEGRATGRKIHLCFWKSGAVAAIAAVTFDKPRRAA